MNENQISIPFNHKLMPFYKKKKIKYGYAKNRELVAIIFEPGKPPKKYSHNIIKENQAKFCDDMKRRNPSAEYVNFYSKLSMEYIERIYLQ